MSHAILVRGEPVYCASDVRVWPETGLGFPALSRRTETRAVVLHWTGGVRGARAVHETLSQRRLSVHFVIDTEGVVWQMADADVACAHAGGPKAVLSANPWSVGVEIVSPGTLRAPGWTYAPESIHGRVVDVARFRDAQIRAANEICDALCRAYGLPMTWPTGPAVAWTRDVLSTYRGVLGHCHVAPHKQDPGNTIWRRLADYDAEHGAKRAMDEECVR